MITIYFATRNKEEIERIRKEYGVKGTLSVNGEIDCELDDKVLERLKTSENELIQIRRKPL